jgi:hypothetical protein
MRKFTLALPLLAVAAAAFPALAHAAPVDFTPQAKTIWRVGACASTDAIPAGLDKKQIDKHCKAIAAGMAKYKKSWLDKATPFFAKVVPSGLPKSIVYPFGGHDLLTALAVFPDATEFTTISLEGSGDPRTVDTRGPRSSPRRSATCCACSPPRSRPRPS